MTAQPLSPEEYETACDVADELFAIMLRIGDTENLHPLTYGQNSVYGTVVSAFSRLFRRLGVPLEDLAAVQAAMGDGSPAEEAIREIRAEKENPS